MHVVQAATDQRADKTAYRAAYGAAGCRRTSQQLGLRRLASTIFGAKRPWRGACAGRRRWWW
jgi:hypothetical protein